MKILLIDDSRNLFNHLIQNLTAEGYWLTPLSCPSVKNRPILKPSAFYFSLQEENHLWLEVLHSTLRASQNGKAVLSVDCPEGNNIALRTVEVRWMENAPEDPASGLRPPAENRKPGLQFLPSPPMRTLYRQLERVADFDTPLLIDGETGCGKQHLAHYVHDASRRRASRPFIEINCAALPEPLMESELFGHESGSFTGAKGVKKGLLETAQGGTAFLDEIGEMPLFLQAKLLKVIEDKRLRRVGGLQEIRLDVRFVTATNRALEAEVEAGRFRRDLFYRLNGFSIHVPPLRERPEDMEFLARAFFEEACGLTGKHLEPLGDEILALFRGYPWPGNIRELRNVVQRAVVMTEADRLRAADLPFHFSPPSAPPSVISEEEPLNHAELKRLNLVRALKKTNGNRTLAAKILGVSRQTVLNKIRTYNIDGPEPFRRPSPSGGVQNFDGD